MRTAEQTALLKKVGAEIKRRRVENNWSQLDLGARIDMEKTNVSRMESGRVNLKILTLYKVAKAFDIPLAQLLNA